MSRINKRIVVACVIILLAASAVLGGYFVIQRQAQQRVQEDSLPDTEVGRLLAKDLNSKYPATPTEVVKLYWRINKCIYNEGMNDKEFGQLLEQLRMLYDEEFLNTEGNSFEEMSESLKSDKEQRRKNKETLSSYVVQKNGDITQAEIDGKLCATVASSVLIKPKKGKSTKTYEQFMLRKNEGNCWKILGWKQIDANTAADIGIE